MEPGRRTMVDLTAIVPRQKTREGPLEASRVAPPTAVPREGFVDDLDVPPLM